MKKPVHELAKRNALDVRHADTGNLPFGCCVEAGNLSFLSHAISKTQKTSAGLAYAAVLER